MLFSPSGYELTAAERAAKADYEQCVEAKVTTSADNYAGRRYSTGNAISEYHAMLNILPQTYTPLTTLPLTGGQGSSSLSRWIISVAAAGLALLVFAGVVSVRRRNAIELDTGIVFDL